MIMLKDNHIDLAGGITAAVERCERYLAAKELNLAIEVECRSLADVNEALGLPGVNRIMLDNFTPEQCCEAVALNGGQKELEASGGITRETAPRAIAAGADVLVAGTATFTGGPAHYAANIAALRGH